MALAAALEARRDELAAEMIAGATRLLPRHVAADPALPALLTDVSGALTSRMAAALSSGDPTPDPTPAEDAVRFARRLAEHDVTVDVLGAVFQVGQRVLVRALFAGLSDVVSPAEFARLAPAVLDFGFAHGEVGYREGVRLFSAARAEAARREGAGLARKAQAVLGGQIDDAELASRMLGYPMVDRHVCLVVGLRSGAARHDGALRESQEFVRRLPGVRDVLAVPFDEITALVWLRHAGPVDLDAWISALSAVAPVHEAAIGVGEPGGGLAGFRETAAQARSAFDVARRAVSRAAEGPGSRGRRTNIVRYSQVSAISFLVEHPERAGAWVRDVLGALAEPGDDRERERATLRAFLASGDNATAVGEAMFVHRNTVKYRVAKATELLPDGLDGHRLDVSLALDYLAWVPLSPSTSSGRGGLGTSGSRPSVSRQDAP